MGWSERGARCAFDNASNIVLVSFLACACTETEAQPVDGTPAAPKHSGFETPDAAMNSDDGSFSSATPPIDAGRSAPSASSEQDSVPQATITRDAALEAGPAPEGCNGRMRGITSIGKWDEENACVNYHLTDREEERSMFTFCWEEEIDCLDFVTWGMAPTGECMLFQNTCIPPEWKAAAEEHECYKTVRECGGQRNAFGDECEFESWIYRADVYDPERQCYESRRFVGCSPRSGRGCEDEFVSNAVAGDGQCLANFPDLCLPAGVEDIGPEGHPCEDNPRTNCRSGPDAEPTPPETSPDPADASAGSSHSSGDASVAADAGSTDASVTPSSRDAG